MATGLPDYYRGIDVTYQTLAQLMNRPKYGAAQKVVAFKLANADPEFPLVSVSGKGMIYGGIFVVDAPTTHASCKAVLKIEGVEICEADFYFLYYFAVDKYQSYPFYLLQYDDTRFIYSSGLSPGYTFETGFDVSFINPYGTPADFGCRIIYALIG